MTQEATIQAGSVYGHLELLSQLHDDSLVEVWEALGFTEKEVTTLAQNDLYAARDEVEMKRDTMPEMVFALYLPKGAPRTQYAMRFHNGKPELYYPVPLLAAADNQLIYGAGRYCASCLQGEAAFLAGESSLTAFVPDFAASLRPADVGVRKSIGLMGIMLSCAVSDGSELGSIAKDTCFCLPTEYTAYFDYRARVLSATTFSWLGKPLTALTLTTRVGGESVTIAGYGVLDKTPGVGEYVAGRLWLQAQVH